MFIPDLNANRNITEALAKKYLKDADPKFRDALQVFIDLLPVSKYRPVTPVGQLLWNQHIQAYENAVFAKPGSDMTPQRALDESTEIVQRELDRMFSQKSGSGHPLGSYGRSVLRAAHPGGDSSHRLVLYALQGGPARPQGGLAGWLFASPWMVGSLSSPADLYFVR